MKFELKTENENHFNLFGHVFRSIISLALIIIFCDVAWKIRIISRHYQIEYKCRLLSVNKSKSYFKNISKLTNVKGKQKIWEFCREFFK